MIFAIDISNTTNILAGIFNNNNIELIPNIEFNNIILDINVNIDEIIEYIKNMADMFFKTCFIKAMVCIPIYYGNIYRKAIITAGNKINLKINLITNITALAIGRDYIYNNCKPYNLLVIDTFNKNKTIITVKEYIYEIIYG